MGFIYNPEEIVEIEYSWSDTNNMAEAYALWQGLIQLEALAINEAMVFEYLNQNQELETGASVKENQTPFSFLSKIEFFHILRILNTEADNAANKTTLLHKGELNVNNEVWRDHLT